MKHAAPIMLLLLAGCSTQPAQPYKYITLELKDRPLCSEVADGKTYVWTCGKELPNLKTIKK